MKDDKNWSTRETDLRIAETIIQQYVDINEGQPLGLFEWYVDPQLKKQQLQIADWVIELAERFEQEYGQEKGTQVTQKVVSFCLMKGQTLH